jgi:hypothetical protein
METIVEVKDDGTIVVPAEALPTATPHTRYRVMPTAGGILLTQEEEPLPFWATATPEERAEAFIKWAQSHTDGPGLPDEALRRENMYD